MGGNVGALRRLFGGEFLCTRIALADWTFLTPTGGRLTDDCLSIRLTVGLSSPRDEVDRPSAKVSVCIFELDLVGMGSGGG